MSLTEQEICGEENSRFAGRIKKIVETCQQDNPEIDLSKRAETFLNKEGTKSRIVWIQVFNDAKDVEKVFSKVPEGLDYPVYSVSLRPEDYGWELLSSDVDLTAIEPSSIVWNDRNGVMIEPSCDFLFTESGRGLLINYGDETDFPMDEDDIPEVKASFWVDLDIENKIFPTRALTVDDFEKPGFVLSQIESGQLEFHPLPRLTSPEVSED